MKKTLIGVTLAALLAGFIGCNSTSQLVSMRGDGVGRLIDCLAKQKNHGN